MGIALVGVFGFAAGFMVGLALLARVIAHNRRRIERLERHQRAQDLVIRHVAVASVEPDPDPPAREFRVFKGAAVVLGALGVVRAHPVRAALAAAGAAATGAVVALFVWGVSPLPPVVADGAPSGTVSMPQSTYTPSVAAGPTGASTTPAAGPSTGVTGAYSPLPSGGSYTAVPTTPASSPISAPSRAPGPSPSGPAPSGSPSSRPTVSAPPSSTPPAQPCLIGVDLLPLLEACVL